jgi:hypothetical protein
MRYIVRSSVTGFLLSLVVAYFIRLWALERGYYLLSTLAGVYIFILLLPIALGAAILVLVILFLLFILLTKGRTGLPFWYKNRKWTRK